MSIISVTVQQCFVNAYARCELGVWFIWDERCEVVSDYKLTQEDAWQSAYDRLVLKHIIKTDDQSP